MRRLMMWLFPKRYAERARWAVRAQAEWFAAFYREHL
jgi:hypothetical protein